MIQQVFRRYDDYRDTGVEWLGEIPKHWENPHLKRLCRKITDGAHTSPDSSSNDYPFLTVVNLNNGKLDFDNCLFTSSDDYEKLVRNGCQPRIYDVLYSKDGTISETAVIDKDRYFVVGSSFIIIRPNLNLTNSVYISYLLSSVIMRFQARIYVKGASLPRISIFNVSKLISIAPPFPEQKAIAAYLDEKAAKIDQQIDLLTQKAKYFVLLKQSLINETVTRGLDKTVPMQDSGNEWIGETPERWSVVRLKDICAIKKGEVFDFESEEGIVPYLNGGMTPSGYSNKCNMPSGLIAVSEGGASSGYTQFMEVPFWCGAHCYAIFPKTKSRKYLYYCIKGLEYVLCELKTGSAMPNLKKTEISNFQIPITNNREEQKAIADYLDSKTTQIDQIVETINAQIERLKELRKTLINDVVTGKIKVVDG